MEDVVVNIHDETEPISQQGFGLPLIFDPDNDIEYQELGEAGDLEDFGSGDMIYDYVQACFQQENSPASIAVYGVDVDAETNITDELDALTDGHNDFYWVGVASRGEDDITETADWAAANERVFMGQPDHEDSVDDIVSMMESLELERVGIFAHDGGPDNEEPFFDAGVIGEFSGQTIGEYTFKWFDLEGVPRSTYSNSDKSQLLDEHCNIYERASGENYIKEGTASDGSFLDTTIIKDWLRVRLTEDLIRLFKTKNKVPYDARGFNMIERVVEDRLKAAFRRDIIAADEDGQPMYETESVSRDEIPDTEIANRKYHGLKATVTIAGAIHDVEVDLYLVV